MFKWIVSLLAVKNAVQSNAVNIQRTDIDYYKDQIIVDYQIAIMANPKKIKNLLNDYNHFSEISRLVRKSRINHEQNNKTILYQDLYPCLLGICYKLSKQQELFLNENGSISAVFTPQQRYFKSGLEKWHVTSYPLGAIIQYTANVTPSFSVPPFFGKLLIRKFVNDEIKCIAKHIQERCR